MRDTTVLDRQYMQQALRLAKKGLGRTYPNPMVGAIIVHHGTVIGKGYHHRAGETHAEIEALGAVKGSPKGATLYVNLEPCAHQGKTPPCVDAIIASRYISSSMRHARSKPSSERAWSCPAAPSRDYRFGWSFG